MTAAFAAAALLAALALAAELALRRLGLGSFPLYERTPGSAYRMRPTQAGRFMNRYRWLYDANGMRNAAVPADFSGVTLLIGDSVVDGGIRLDQNQTLAARTSHHSGERFYAVACHGWALANSLPAVTALQGWMGAKRLVFLLNTGDLDAAGKPGNELSFPTRRPFWLTLWLVRRQVFRQFMARRHAKATEAGSLPSRLDPPMRAGNLRAFRQLLADYAGPVIVVRYAMRGENPLGERFFEELASLDPRVRILEADQAAGWSDDCYIDHIHPNVRGVETLARHLCQGLS